MSDVSTANREELEKMHDNLNPFVNGQKAFLTLEVTDRKAFWEFVSKNMYAPKEVHDIPGATLHMASWKDSKEQLDRMMDTMIEFLRENGRL